MKLETLTMPKEKAKKLWQTYNETITQKNYKYLQELKTLYWHLKNGRKIIDIFEVFKKVGLNESFQPKLAISRADENIVSVRIRQNGSVQFDSQKSWYISLPEKTYETQNLKFDNTSWFIQYQTKVPIIPITFLPKGNLKNYFILFEVEKWEKVTKDPILLKRITRNLFVALAFWNLSPLERALIKGR